MYTTIIVLLICVVAILIITLNLLSSLKNDIEKYAQKYIDAELEKFGNKTYKVLFNNNLDDKYTMAVSFFNGEYYSMAKSLFDNLEWNNYNNYRRITNVCYFIAMCMKNLRYPKHDIEKYLDRALQFSIGNCQNEQKRMIEKEIEALKDIRKTNRYTVVSYIHEDE